MIKLFHLLLLILIFIVTMNHGKKDHKVSTGMIRKLQGMFPAAKKKESIEKLFQDIFLERQTNDKLQFGYVCENPSGWEQRFEEKDLLENRHRGKVKWANIDGGYGEHYWDINH
ncbi:uncharacterized protein LOC143185205 [Calliopsis andreniformis]|uniref:uncharacterized protein LOC143185205 n=1 Tax=Calliopsis andreniformis TaxID=337506 RepID=UPI003FCDD7B3